MDWRTNPSFLFTLLFRTQPDSIKHLYYNKHSDYWYNNTSLEYLRQKTNRSTCTHKDHSVFPIFPNILQEVSASQLFHPNQDLTLTVSVKALSLSIILDELTWQITTNLHVVRLLFPCHKKKYRLLKEKPEKQCFSISQLNDPLRRIKRGLAG